MDTINIYSWAKANKFQILVLSVVSLVVTLVIKQFTSGLLLLGIYSPLVAIAFLILWKLCLQFHRIAVLGLVITLLGFTGNFTVLLLNGGYMPATVPSSGLWISGEGARVFWLGDWILGIISPGDIVVVIGAILIAVGFWLILDKKGVR